MKLAVVLLCGCNSILGLSSTRPSDGAIPFFDGHPDAPFACSTLGDGVPAFAPQLYQAVTQPCFGYTLSQTGTNDHAMARCPDVRYGPKGATSLDAATGITPTAPSIITDARLAPDDNRAFADFCDNSAAPTQTTTVEYSFDGTRWNAGTMVISVATNACGNQRISTPTRGSPRHAVYEDQIQGTLFELVETASGPWNSTALQTLRSLTPFAYVDTLSLSPDGLRLVFSDPTGLHYSDRSALGTPFALAKPISTAPGTGAETPFMTEDCSHLYFSGLDSVFFAKQ